MDEKIKIIIDSLGGERVKLNEKLSYHVFSKLGGMAECFYIATSEKELVEVLNIAYELKLPYLVFGNGTKLLVSEKGISGLVIKNRADNLKVGAIKGKVSASGIGVEEAVVEVDSGVSLLKLNEFLFNQKLKQIEGISSLKSTVGGSIFLDPVLRGLCQKVKVWESGEVFDMSVSELQIGKQVILRGVFKIKALN